MLNLAGTIIARIISFLLQKKATPQVLLLTNIVSYKKGKLGNRHMI